MKASEAAAASMRGRQSKDFGARQDATFRAVIDQISEAAGNGDRRVKTALLVGAVGEMVGAHLKLLGYSVEGKIHEDPVIIAW